MAESPKPAPKAPKIVKLFDVKNLGRSVLLSAAIIVAIIVIWLLVSDYMNYQGSIGQPKCPGMIDYSICNPFHALIYIFLPSLRDPGLMLVFLAVIFFGLGAGFAWDEKIRVLGKIVPARSLFVVLSSLVLIVGALMWLVSVPIFVEAAKPVIYLDPETAMPVRVSLDVPGGRITKVDPTLDSGNGWNVVANPDGKTVWNGEGYPYLFYEAALPDRLSKDTFWVVKGSEVNGWFSEMLPKMGLNGKETKDFTDYWSVNLPKANYYKISLVKQEQYDEAVKLDIEPKPDTVIRVILVIGKLDKPVNAVEPVLVIPERKGFTAVEWGVILK